MAAVVGIHLLYIVYLHFGFHVVVEGTVAYCSIYLPYLFAEIDEILGDAPVANVPVKLEIPVTV